MADTQKGRRLFIAITSGTTPSPQPNDLDQAGYEALTWLQVKKVGSIGATGTAENIQAYDVLDGDVAEKNKGAANAGDPVVDLSRTPTDPGQQALRAAGATKYKYAFKIIDADEPSADYVGTIHYHRGIASAPVRPNGAVEDFHLERFTLGLVQREIVVNPAPGSAPTNTVKPSISGASVQVGVTLTAIEGSWTGDPTSFTYQWKHDASGNGTYANVSVGGTGKTYVPVVGDIADSIQVAVTAINGAGSSSAANSLGTVPIIAA